MGPSLEDEAAFLSEQRAAEAAEAPPSVAAGSTVDEKGELPPLEDLVQRVPASTRGLIDELFRAKFTTVRRVPKSALKS